MNTSPRLSDLGFRALNVLHRLVVRASGGRIGARAFGLDMVELITVGRRSGRSHSTMLLVPVIDGPDLVVVASKGGDPRDPDWFENLEAKPEIVVVRHGRHVSMTARVASPDERAILWPRVVARYRQYERYQRRAGRVIPLVVCSPRVPTSEK